MTRLHVDPVAGASGDMLLGALIDAGAPLDAIRADLSALGVPGWDLAAERVTRHGLAGTRAIVRTGDAAHHRAASELVGIVRGAGLRDRVADRASAVIERLATVEAAIHSVRADAVHLHEVGALDTLIDVVGVCSALDHLGISDVTCGALPTGSGTIHTAHGELPVPAPAAVAVLAGTGLVWRHTDDPLELVTPTGAALLAEFARPALGTTLAVRATGYGFGSSTKLARANCCRILLGADDGTALDTVIRLATTIDDQTPEELAAAVARCLKAGALDAWLTPVMMKKGRLGSDVTVLCRPADEGRLVDVLFDHTTTLGVRRDEVDRHIADREERVVDVEGHTVRVKLRRFRGRALGVKPELDDCVAVAAALGTTVDAVRRRALTRFDG